MGAFGLEDLPAHGSIPVRRMRRVRRPLRWFGAAAVVAVAMAGATAWAEHGPHGPGGPGGAEGWHGGDSMMPWGGPPEHAARAVDHFLDGLGASDAQRTQIKGIVQAAMGDVAQQRATERSLHQRELAVFTAPTVDGAAAEALRAQLQAQHELSSRRMLQAMLDVSQVLTPAQRAKIGARLQEHQAVMQDRMQRMRAEHEHQGHDGPHDAPMPRGPDRP